jgi:hypothetical protein
MDRAGRQFGVAKKRRAKSGNKLECLENGEITIVMTANFLENH